MTDWIKVLMSSDFYEENTQFSELKRKKDDIKTEVDAVNFFMKFHKSPSIVSGTTTTYYRNVKNEPKETPFEKSILNVFRMSSKVWVIHFEGNVFIPVSLMPLFEIEIRNRYDDVKDLYASIFLYDNHSGKFRAKPLSTIEATLDEYTSDSYLNILWSLFFYDSSSLYFASDGTLLLDKLLSANYLTSNRIVKNYSKKLKRQVKYYFWDFQKELEDGSFVNFRVEGNNEHLLEEKTWTITECDEDEDIIVYDWLKKTHIRIKPGQSREIHMINYDENSNPVYYKQIIENDNLNF